MSKGEETYQRMIDVAIYFFAKDGIHKTSFSKIAEALKMTKPSLYYYVKSKDELILKVFNYIFEDYSYESYFEKKTLKPQEIEEYLIEGGLNFIDEVENQDIILNLLNEFALYANRLKEQDERFIQTIYNARQSFITGFSEVLQSADIADAEISLRAQTLALLLDNIQNYKMLNVSIEANELWIDAVKKALIK